MIITNVSEAKARLSRLLERVSRGEEVVIGRAGRPVARLIPYRHDPSPRGLSDIWADRVEIADDFDDLPEELERSFAGDDEPAPLTITSRRSRSTGSRRLT
jgi:prevent-host-death family protein